MDAQGNLYATLDVSVPSDAPDAPKTGIYRVGAEGGDAELFASDEAMLFPNGIHVDGDRLFVTDSKGGAVFQVALADGAVTAWVQHEELEPLADSCGPAAIRLGANGIVKLGDAFYVANTDRAQIVKIPVTATGAAGTPEVVLGPDCASLFGLDDVRATPDGKLVYAVNYGNRIGLAGPDGSTETLLQGEPLDGPASLEVLADPLRIVVTNSSFGSFFTGQTASPSLVTLTVE
jgi:sugar lactone lactonase YvrE